ncbi:PEGA domain-containing protein [Salinispira pacifica]
MKRIELRRAAALLLAAAAMVLSSCATESGSTYSNLISAESQRAGKGDSSSTGNMREGKEEVSSSSSTGENGEKVDTVIKTHVSPHIEIDTSPSGAEVYLNGRFQGFSPVTVDTPSQGSYSLRVSHDGFYTFYRYFTVNSDSSVRLDITLAPLMGYLSVRRSPPDAEVVIDGTRVYQTLNRLSAGLHRVTVRRFGYTDQVQTVQIIPEQTVHLDVQLQKAPFRLEQVSASRSRFNPNNPGPLGTTAIRFRVSSYGSGTVTIEGAGGTGAAGTIKTFVVNNFDTWDQEVTWNGTDSSGAVVPDGTYIANVEVQSADGGPLQRDSTVVYVNSALAIRFRDMLSANPGLAFAPIPDTLPDGSLQVSTEFLGHVGRDGSGAVVGRFPVTAGLRYGLPLNLEAIASVQGVLHTDPALNDGSVSLGVRWRFLSLPFPDGEAGALIAAKGTFLSEAATDTLTNFDGFGLSLPVGVRFGPVGISFTPEIVGNSYPVYPVSAPWTPDLFIWGYGRAALYVDTGTILAGISAAARTRPLSAPPGTSVPFDQFYQLPFEAAAEFHLMIPGTSVVVGITGAAEISSPTDYYVMAGGGIGFLY